MINRSVFPTPSRAIALQFHSSCFLFLGCLLLAGFTPTHDIRTIYQDYWSIYAGFSPAYWGKKTNQNHQTIPCPLIPRYHYNMSNHCPEGELLDKFFKILSNSFNCKLCLCFYCLTITL